MTAEVARRGLHRECVTLWARILNHSDKTASPEDTLTSIRAEEAHEHAERAKPKVRYQCDPPPGGVPVLGRDFFAGPEPYQPYPDRCPCGCGQRATPRHPGLAK